VDFIAQGAVTHGILSHIGCCRAVDFIMQWVVKHGMLPLIGCCRTKDAFVQKIFLCTGYRSRYANDWFSGQLQDHFLTNWRGILKILERFLFRTNQIKKPLSYLKNISYFGRFEGIFEPYFFSFYDFLSETCFCDTYFDQMEMNFKKLRDFFLYNELKYKNLSQFR
jgi:hypothetical protein